MSTATTTSKIPAIPHIAKLANLTTTEAEQKNLEAAFSETFGVIANLQSVPVSGVQPTFQVTGLENVLRADEVDQLKMFSQSQALANAKETHEGYIVVNQVIEQE